MAAGTTTEVKLLNEEVGAIVSDGSTVIYMGTKKGNVYSYNAGTKALTTLCNVGAEVISIALYSSVLYVGLAGGGLATVTTS